jgi:hypothetical protein
LLLGERGHLPLKVRDALFGGSEELISRPGFGPEKNEDLHETLAQFWGISRPLRSKKIDKIFVPCFGSE